MKTILDWLDHRTGYRELIHATLYEPVPGGARWRYVWGSTLVFTFTVQLITGLFLWMAYSPSSQTAWESVYYIQHEMQFGWLLRGIHHFTAQIMVVLLAIHLLQVIVDGAYRAPREVNFWLGLILMKIVLGLSLTGYLLPWDQKGYWATQVATSLSTIIPGIGPSVQRLVVGGTTYGHHTLTRFFAMHAGLLPALLIAFLALHIYVFRRHGITAKLKANETTAPFWPDQVLKDAVACLGVLMVVLLLVFWNALSAPAEFQQTANEGRVGELLGADLGAPADPAAQYSAARPEWYFLFLFQFLKYFKGDTELYGAIVIPGAVFFVLFLMPFIGRWKLGHRFNIAYLGCVLVGIAVLTGLALNDDAKSKSHQEAVADAEMRAERVVELMKGTRGVGTDGARAMLRNDPKLHGAPLFAEKCAQCHSHESLQGSPESPPTAADLTEFGTRNWIKGFLKDPAGPRFFGPTIKGSFKGEPLDDRFVTGEMADWSKTNIPSMSEREIDGVVEFLFAQGNQENHKTIDAELVQVGRAFFENGNEQATSCSDCHGLRVDGETIGDLESGYPQLTGYGSVRWLNSFIADPGASEHYGEKNAMVSFKDRLTQREINLLARWIRHDWYEAEPSQLEAE